jgi:hypothetical protein
MSACIICTLEYCELHRPIRRATMDVCLFVCWFNVNKVGRSYPIVTNIEKASLQEPGNNSKHETSLHLSTSLSAVYTSFSFSFSFSSSTYSYLANHSHIMYECDTCTFGSYYAYDVYKHMDDHGHRAPVFECDTCSRDFSSQHAVQQHMNALDHWAPRFDCETCRRSFSNQHAVNQHMKALDHWSCPFDCDFCDSAYRTEDAVEEHMEKCPHRPMYSCDHCEQRFRTEVAARAHMDGLGHWRRGHDCEQCDRHFQNANNLTQVSHEPLRPPKEKVHAGRQSTRGYLESYRKDDLDASI